MIHIVIGTKAQLIKMAPIMKLLQEKGVNYNFISTGQHKHTISEMLADFQIKVPDSYLYSGKDITSIPQMVLWGGLNLMRTALQRNKFFRGDTRGIVLVHGDTFSTLLGALMAKFAGLQVAHVESGLRSFHLLEPFPEEIIRILTFHFSDYLFCPDENAVRNLNGHKGEKVKTDGNTLYDAMRIAIENAPNRERIRIPEKPYVIGTIHRFENIHTAQSLQKIVNIIERIAQDYLVIFVLHKPTQKQLQKHGFLQKLSSNPNIELHQRYSYFDFLTLISRAKFLVSDGGSNQEECYYMGKPILLLRRATERLEGIGENALLSEYKMELVEQFLASPEFFARPPRSYAHSPSAKIVDVCCQFAN